jgi:hypothetical protein
MKNIHISILPSQLPEQEAERGYHIWIKQTTYRYTVHNEPQDGTIVESTTCVVEPEKEQSNG